MPRHTSWFGRVAHSISGCKFSITTDGNARAMSKSTEIHQGRKDKTGWLAVQTGQRTLPDKKYRTKI